MGCLTRSVSDKFSGPRKIRWGVTFGPPCINNFFQHPGGSEVLLENLGRDATLQFKSVGHSEDAVEMLRPYLVGILPEEERMW